MRRRFMLCGAGLVAVVAAAGWAEPEESKTLLTMVREWQYPDSKMSGGATMRDGETVNRSGERTVPSTLCTTVLITKDPLAKVVEYYKARLKPEGEAAKGAGAVEDKSAKQSGRSVLFHEDSKDRPVGVHIIVVNTDKTSTTLVISRAEKEAETHIAWTHYVRHSL